VAVHSATGDSQIITTLEGTLSNINLSEDAVGIGIVIDADYGKGEGIGRFNSIKQDVEELEMPDKPGEVLKGHPNTGIFVFPDNINNGTLETVLLKCAKAVYPKLRQGAETFINDVDIDSLASKDKQDFKKPSGRDKATSRMHRRCCSCS